MYPLGRYVGIRVGESSFFALVKPGTRWPVRREIELVLQTRGGAAQATVLEAFTPEVASAAEVGHLRVEGLPRRGGRECRGLLCLDVDRLGRAQAMMAVEGVESVAELSFGLGPYSCAGERLS